MAKFRIIHISDLHLFVDRDGNHRSLEDRARTARWMDKLGNALEQFPNERVREWAGELFGGLDTHSDSALNAMLATIDGLLDDRSVPTIVLQTGDISTFGALGSGNGMQFPEWEYWQGPLQDERRGRAVWIDLFGNHDVWPGTLPALGARYIDEAVRTFRERHFPRCMPLMVRVESDGVALELHVVNSVLASAGDNTFAWGELIPDSIDPTAPPAVDTLAQVGASVGAGHSVIRGLLMHHPPHHFEKAGGSSEKGLRDAARLGAWLSQQAEDSRFQLVIAGHRHAVDPPVPVAHPYAQLPLPERTLQLVCSTPTQVSTPRPSFSVYEIESAGKTATLTRRIYSRKGLADRRFRGSDGGTFELAL